MIKLVGCSACLILAAALLILSYDEPISGKNGIFLQKVTSSNEQAFLAYVATHSKRYLTKEEYSRRLEVFRRNKFKITEHNKKT
jgi:C1A family cysteine protease